MKHGHLSQSLVPFALFGALTWALCIYYYSSASPGRLDVLGDAYAHDFINFWTAGRLLTEGRPLDIFNLVGFWETQKSLYNPDLPIHFWSYPPPALILVYPLGYFDYFGALLVWVLAGFVAIIPAVRALIPDRYVPFLIIMSPAMAVNVALGQNGAFTAALMIGGLACMPRRPVLAGVLFGLLIFKPHLGLMLPLITLAERRWTTFAVAGLTAIGMCLVSGVIFGWEVWPAFLEKSLAIQKLSMSIGGGYFLWMMPSAFAAARDFGLNEEALWAQLPFFVIGVTVVWLGCRSERSYRDKIVLVIIGTFVASPQSFNYDLIPLAIAALLIAQHGRLELLSRILWYLPVLCFVLAMFGAPVASLVLTFALWKVYTDTRPAQQVARNEVAETKLPVSAPA